MSSTVSTTVGGVVVVTHVHPAPQGAAPQHLVGIQKFTKGRPMALGTIQIMIGLITLLFGIVMAINADTLGVFSGFFIWGALIHILAGSLTVAAGKSLNRCLVNGTLGVSVLAAVVSCIATILHSLDATGIMWRSCYGYSDPSNRGEDMFCLFYQARTQGVLGVLIVFNLLELIVSITVAGYGCCASYSAEESSVVVISADASLTRHAPPSALFLKDIEPPEEPLYHNQSMLLSSAEESV
ncbi:membrane-spanning 4-domains subfamily A member 15-like isoform X1 [Lates japonicus]|uniref:Membrane-spanning 4-domains subfamily A member 15-like isoform X1 n=1 Tax=Lates japonicus TaxID=270547 RepID=A0AAD3MPX4_LATJO|nr:membrane-spanning 4-domains subfamily A member 15-like isoform X1 [Lates japonicus]